MENNIIIYQTQDGKTKIDVKIEDETVWLTQNQMVELFQSSKANISEHISHIFDEGELNENSVVRNFRTTAEDGKNYNTKHYNLDVIISVGYRVKSLRGTQFRIWATKVIKDYITKGFVVDKERLKNIGINIKSERLRRNISQERLAELTNISRNSVSLIETGKINPTILKVIDIANALGTDLNALTKEA